MRWIERTGRDQLGKLGGPARAARLLGAAAALLDEMGIDNQPSDQHEVAKYTADVASPTGRSCL